MQEWKSHVCRTFNLSGKAANKGLCLRSWVWLGVTGLQQLIANAQFILFLLLFLICYIYLRCSLSWPWTLNPPTLAPKFWDYQWANSIFIFSLQTPWGLESMLGHLNAPFSSNSSHTTWPLMRCYGLETKSAFTWEDPKLGHGNGQSVKLQV